MAVSLIYSVFHSFGAGLASSKFGINFQNRGAGFTLAEGHPNEAGGGKRPMHTIIPAMLKKAWARDDALWRDGRGLPAQRPCPLRDQHGRLRHGPAGRHRRRALLFRAEGFQIETGYRPEVRAALAGMGHHVVDAEGPIGGAQAILIEDSGILQGASDPRKDGCALGY
jgi:gamma-glutamyltranspeptidase / glutathione hydrolase